MPISSATDFAAGRDGCATVDDAPSALATDGRARHSGAMPAKLAKPAGPQGQSPPAKNGRRATTRAIAAALLAWYERHARVLPWRIGPKARERGERPDPYRVWLSEVMLQQTTVKAVAPYFLRFVERWPTIRALAAADEHDIMAAWAGLGYYSPRAQAHRMRPRRRGAAGRALSRNR